MNKINWLEIHEECLEDVDDIRKALKIHKVTPQVKGIGLIRALIFAEAGNGVNKLNPKSVFSRDSKASGNWRIG